MADLYIQYNISNGKYIGHVFGSNVNLNSSLNYRLLTKEERSQIGQNYSEYRYNSDQIEKLLEVNLTVVPSTTYVLDKHNKISVCLNRAYDTSDSEYSKLLNNQYKIKINGEEFNILFEEQIFLTPDQIGIYVVELFDDRIYSKNPRRVITIVETQEQ